LAITDAAGVGSPSADDEAWAATCAAAISAAITTRLAGLDPQLGDGAYAELTRSALLDGIAAYRGRDAPDGVLSLGPDGTAVRIGADILRASSPVLARYVMPGIG